VRRKEGIVRIGISYQYCSQWRLTLTQRLVSKMDRVKRFDDQSMMKRRRERLGENECRE